MRIFQIVRQRMRALFFGARLDREAREELQQHFEQQVQMHETSGLTAEQAQRAATLDIGGLPQLEEQVRDARGLSWWDNFIADARYGFRQIRRRPGSSLAAIVTLALGVGATAAVFGVVDAVVLRPMPFPDSSRLYSLYEINSRSNVGRTRTSALNFMDWRQQASSFDGMAAFAGTGFTLTGRGDPDFVIGQMVTTNLLDVLKVRPILGRNFLPHESNAGSNRVVILSHRLWARDFNSDPAVVNTVTTINGLPYYVIGVMPKWFEYPSDRYELFTPLVTKGKAAGGPPINRGSRFLRVVGRLKSGVTEQRARTELSAISQGLAEDYPEANEKVSIGLSTLKQEIVGDTRSELLLVLGAVAVVLLIACVNVAGLAIARGSARTREFGVRLAIGASRARLVRQLATEGLVLFVLGGAAGVALAAWTLTALRSQLPPNLPRLYEIGIDWRFVAFGGAMTLVAGLMFSIVPALSLIRRDMAPDLASSRGAVSASRRTQRSRAVLIVGEIAATLVLLSGAVLALRSFDHVLRVDAGFERSGVMTFGFVLFDKRYPAAADIRTFAERVSTALESSPAVKRVGLTSALPLSEQNIENRFAVDGSPTAEGAEPPIAGVRAVAGHYMEALGADLLRGRDLQPADTATSEPVVVVTSDFVSRYVRAANPIGVRIKMGDGDSEEPWRKIVGVVASIRHNALDAPPRPEVWLPFAQMPDNFLTTWMRGIHVAARTAGDPHRAMPELRAQMRALDSEMPLLEVLSLEDLASKSTSARRLEAGLLAAFASIAVTLAAVGLFGIIAFYVTQHMQEFGVRLALGAAPQSLLTLVLRRALWLTAIGTAIGVPAAILLGRGMRSILYGVEPADPLAIGTSLALLLAVTLTASAVPARRAMRTDPLVALRVD